MSEKISRRTFLKTGCLASAGLVVALGGGAAIANSYQPEIELPNTTYGDASSKKRVLIAYATKAGSTANSAARMGEILSKKGHLVDVKPINTITGIDSYQAVVLGSAIRRGSILRESLTFIENNQALLKQLPFSFFIHCMTLSTDNEAKRAEASAYLDPVRAIVKPVSEGLFAGAMVPEKLKLLDRVLTVDLMKLPVGDFRNWNQINAWVENIPVG
jgi:menaquinone-dependent protoporphyrinogen oxidase